MRDGDADMMVCGATEASVGTFFYRSGAHPPPPLSIVCLYLCVQPLQVRFIIEGSRAG